MEPVALCACFEGLTPRGPPAAPFTGVVGGLLPLPLLTTTTFRGLFRGTLSMEFAFDMIGL